MEQDLSQFKSIIFDSDGVIINSNDVKLRCFEELASWAASDEDAARVSALVNASKGLTRYEIIAFIENVARARKGVDAPSYECLLSKFSEMAYTSILRCEVDEAIYTFRERCPASAWFVLTAGDEEETKRIYSEIGIASLFQGGIYGAPMSKAANLRKILFDADASRRDEILIIGDSYSDAELALDFGIAFALVTHWSSCRKAQDYCELFNLPVFLDISELLRANRDGVAKQ